MFWKAFYYFVLIMSLSIDKIVDAQVHIGTLKSEAHPKTKPYRLDVVNDIVVLNPEVIIAQLEHAKKKIQKAKKDGKNVLVACEKKMYAEELEKIANQAGVTFLNRKIPAGFLTNFPTFQSRVASMNKMLEYLNSEEFAYLTKKEQLVHKRKLLKIERVYK
ncbi:MAG: 30S ribosomal protein S2 [bacterium]|nr:30S ribosomal protein S2 [bacterium]